MNGRAVQFAADTANNRVDALGLDQTALPPVFEWLSCRDVYSSARSML